MGYTYLKSGKLASKIASILPVSLTSCIAKLMERILANRIYYQAEHTNMFSKLQAGFRKGRSCEDIIRSENHGWFRPKALYESSVLVLLEFSKAYDTV